MYGFEELVALFEELEPGAALSEDDQVDWAAKHARDRERPPGNQQVDVDSIGQSDDVHTATDDPSQETLDRRFWVAAADHDVEAMDAALEAGADIE